MARGTSRLCSSDPAYGAVVTETADDGKGALLSQLRAVLGMETPIIVMLDLHANVTAEMAALATALISYRTDVLRPHFHEGVGAIAPCNSVTVLN